VVVAVVVVVVVVVVAVVVVVMVVVMVVVVYAAKQTHCRCSDRIKARVSRSCVSLCSCCVRILLSSAASVAQCFALRQTDFEHAFDDPTQRIAVGVSADQRVRNRGIIGENIRKFLREDLSEATASSQANILACSIMLSLMREIDNTLLLTAYHFLIRGGNDAACRFPLLCTHFIACVFVALV
jgi:hypothetical protein